MGMTLLAYRRRPYTQIFDQIDQATESSTRLEIVTPTITKDI